MAEAAQVAGEVMLRSTRVGAVRLRAARQSELRPPLVRVRPPAASCRSQHATYPPARVVLVWRPSARSERPCDLCGVHNCCLRVPLPCCLGLCPSGGRVPSSALHALPHSGSRWESGTSQIPASPEGCHVALWRAAEGGAYHGTQPSRCLGESFFALVSRTLDIG